MLIVNLDMLSLYIPTPELKKPLLDAKSLNIHTIENILKTAYISDEMMENEKAVKIAVTFRSIYTNEVLVKEENNKFKCVFYKDVGEELNSIYDTYVYVKEIFEERFSNVRNLGVNTDIKLINIINTNDSIFLYYNVFIPDQKFEMFKENVLEGEFIPISTITNLTNLEKLSKIIIPTLKIVERGNE